MKICFIFVEGDTEENFCKTVLQPHLKNFGVHLKIFNCKGTIKYQSLLRKFILYQANTNGISLVTTMFDFYALPNDFPGKNDLPTTSDCYLRVTHVERALAVDLEIENFLPYLCLHEFEALLFSAPEEIARTFPERDISERLIRIKVAYHNNPEKINDGEMTAPSKRIKTLCPQYNKSAQGSIIIQRIGLDVIRAECAHFNEWLTKLESLGQSST